MPKKKVVLALSTVLIVLTMAFSAVAFAQDPRTHDHATHDHEARSQGHSQERSTSGKQQDAHWEEEAPAPWLPVAFTLSGAVVLGGLVVILRRS